MSDANKTNPMQTVIVIAIGAAIGFGAIYAISRPSDNNSGAQQTLETADRQSATDSTVASAATKSRDSRGRQVQSIPFNTSERLKDLGQKDVAKTSPAPTNSAASGGTSAGTDANGQKLNRGEMTTFVYKKQPMPMPAVSFNGPDGNPMSFNDFNGKVVLVNLWATWCAPCRKEMPYLNTLQQELGSNEFEVVAISVDRGSADKSRKFLDEVKATSLTLYHDPTAQLGSKLKAIGMPSTILMDRQGRELGRLVGPAEWHSEDAKRLIRAAIAATG